MKVRVTFQMIFGDGQKRRFSIVRLFQISVKKIVDLVVTNWMHVPIVQMVSKPKMRGCRNSGIWGPVRRFGKVGLLRFYQEKTLSASKVPMVPILLELRTGIVVGY